jgi:N-acetylglucosamine kinase-like BadF-type ATPase
MILIADSGSSKTLWNIVRRDGTTALCRTAGINPFYSDAHEIIALLRAEYRLESAGLSTVFFYGAGCTSARQTVLREALHDFFDAGRIEIHSDLLGTARAMCGNRPGIACILGTGSNSCRYDGAQIVENVAPLGYVLGNEGGGDSLGKRLLADVLKHQLPDSLCRRFLADCMLSTDEILERIYRQPFPNRFLAGFTHFIADHIHEPALDKLVTGAFREFFVRNVLQYRHVNDLPLYFTGSVATVFRPQLCRVAGEFGLTIAAVAQSPMQGLVVYHRNKIA